jgi:hypothetical protein
MACIIIYYIHNTVNLWSNNKKLMTNNKMKDSLITVLIIIFFIYLNLSFGYEISLTSDS